MVKHCINRKTVVLPLVKTSKKFRDILNSKGFRAAEVNGDSKDRQEILEDFDNDKYNVLCNSMLLTEGWDCPSVDCSRFKTNKSSVLIFSNDRTWHTFISWKGRIIAFRFLWHTERHELCHPAHLIANSDEVAKND